jgi:hypothetical protein
MVTFEVDSWNLEGGRNEGINGNAMWDNLPSF